MHNAPSVTYPVGRCSFRRRLFSTLCWASLGLLIAWAWTQPIGWTFALGCALVMLVNVLARHGEMSGRLHWDGDAWRWHSDGAFDAAEVPEGEVQVVLDVQKALLLKWQPLSDTLTSAQWLWLDVERAPADWQNLRRAVYARH